VKEQKIIGAGLTLMSFSSGCVDILSYRFLGQVFTSAMTGNVALMGLDLGQGEIGAASRNMTAFSGFISGLVVGALIMRHGADRRRLLTAALTEAALLLVFALGWQERGVDAALYALIGLSAIAMGLQSALAHRIGMPSITTTYFTGTMTGIVFGLVGSPSSPHPTIKRTFWPLAALLSYIAGAVLAGWYTAGRSAPELSPLLPAIPCAAALALALTIVLARPPTRA
jgi:uncharacterized membrane protein YoaK (UPF0700 family)